MSGPRHVLLTADAVGGVWTYAVELGAALAARGVAVALAVLGPPASSGQRAEAARAGTIVHETGLDLDWTVADPAALASVTRGLMGLGRRLGVDAVQLHSPALVGEAVWPVPVLAVVHSCVGTWWEAVRGDAAVPPDLAWRMAAVARGLAAADLVVAPSQALADAVRRVYGTGRRIKVVHNGRGGLTGAADRPRHGVVTAGRLWDEGKNVAVLDRAATMMAVPVRAAGALAGPNGAEFAPRALQALGKLDEAGTAAALAGARVFASPALYEPFGLAVVEAAAMGLPLVLADIASFRELWEGAAVFLPARDATSWARALTDLHGDPAACRRLGEAARTRAAAYGTAPFGAAMAALLAALPAHRAAA